MKYTHDTWANKMEEGRDTIQGKKRAIHDDTKIWGKTDPTFGGNRPPIPRKLDSRRRATALRRPRPPRSPRVKPYQGTTVLGNVKMGGAAD